MSLSDVGLVALVLAGAAITIASAMVAGLRLERWLSCYVRVPQDSGAVIGLVVGIVTVATWLR
jgi:hypothetical protein